MKLSAPVYRLKRQARILSREKNIRLHEALDQIAIKEGFTSWSLLSSHVSLASPAKNLLAVFDQGDLVLIGARPGHGKTQLGLEVALEAISTGSQAIFFTLDYSTIDISNLFSRIDRNLIKFNNKLEVDTSDRICADYIIARLSEVPKGTVAVIDYLQVLDQRRSNPELEKQIDALKSFAKEQKLIMVFLSQIDRAFDYSNNNVPDLDDVRLPNPLDLGCFTKTCFLNNGDIRISSAQ